MSQGSPPAGSKPAPVTEIITSETGPSIRRIRKLRIGVLDGPAQEVGEVHAFAQDEVRVGSGTDCDVVVSDPSVSREHLAIRLVADGFQVTDLRTTNGTYVGDVRIREIVVSTDTILRLGKSTLRLVPSSETVEHEVSPRAAFGRMLGASAAMRETFALLERVAASDLTVLIEGETGTGKELAAEGVHEASHRAAGPFVAVNCGAIPKELLESELLGHEKGAFTGAVKERKGAFAAADGGTIFLDEIGELPLEMQAKLLRVLERREVKPVGSDRSFPVDVRVVAATNRALVREVAEGRFRQDLYYRLAVVTVRIPPLRTRLEDLRLLVDAIWSELARRREAQGLPAPVRLDATAMAMLARYDFPGNVRELRNVVERWAVLGPSAAPPETRPREPAIADAEPSPRGASEEASLETPLLDLPYHEAREALLERFEKHFVERALEKSGGNVSKAAREAGVDRRHLQRLMSRFGIERSS
jgi:transcriptional regulator with GAF, ATPase, and Fis domain